LFKESEVLARLENASLLIVNGSGGQVVELEEAKINSEAAKQQKQLVVIESANHALQCKEKQTIQKNLQMAKQTKPQQEA